MPQHLWLGTSHFRICEVCEATQFAKRGKWCPHVGPICPGDDDEDGRPVTRRKPNAPAGDLRVLETAL